MQKYFKALENQVFAIGRHSLVPIRFEDRMEIMKWRNEQIYHLRQDKVLTMQDQDSYFRNVIDKSFDESQPPQLLFSFLEDNRCIGYGGLVHINWVDKNAEISFIINTQLEEQLAYYWHLYLQLIEKVAFNDLKLHKVYTYAFDVRPQLYSILLQSGYEEDARLKDHCLFKGNYIDVLIHCKINGAFHFRRALYTDVNITFKWANDPLVRKFSLTQSPITWESHLEWYRKKITDNNCAYFIVMYENIPIGSLRLDVSNTVATISYLLDPIAHGKGLGTKVLKAAQELCTFFNINIEKLCGVVKKGNIASIKIFEKLGYQSEENLDTYHFEKKLNAN
ncbi:MULTISPECIES: GNAT family N-acetyltransferase [Sphingobacterium]|jgi:RimJ/RimL family protein N-acetyltransferase|uniref:GNAT family N-acetyltransferase n=1 Tax=Sphingobacterium TaxID=28453 RepID=UPI00257F8BC5|nr:MULTISPECIES: GNAT family N-acetyltransferase [Sphingobacterium]MDF2849800.1 hypothetical protein [Sphingobacterium multivorum]